MPKFSTSKLVQHRACDMFDLVADISKYPEFLPMCEDLTITKAIENAAEGTKLLVADMTIGYKFIHESFTTEVNLDKKNNIIIVKYIDGPFKYLENRWSFRDIDVDNRQSLVEFFIEYELKSKTLAMLAGSVFDLAFAKFSDAFEKRADQIYGLELPSKSLNLLGV